MNRIFKTLLIALAGLMMMGCEPHSTEQPLPQLEVTPNNIAGSWELVEWMGAPLAEGNYVYLDIVRSGRTYTMYQNIDSFDKRTITGRYYIEQDDQLRYVINGKYDHSAGDWNKRYIIDSLNANEMIWVAIDNKTDVSLYRRCTIPAEITNDEAEE